VHTVHINELFVSPFVYISSLIIINISLYKRTSTRPTVRPLDTILPNCNYYKYETGHAATHLMKINKLGHQEIFMT